MSEGYYGSFRRIYCLNNINGKNGVAGNHQKITYEGIYMIQLEHPSQEDIEEKIKSKESFLVLNISGLKELMKYCFLIVKIIQNNHMTCRVKQEVEKLWLFHSYFTTDMVVFRKSSCSHLVTLNPEWIIT